MLYPTGSDIYGLDNDFSSIKLTNGGEAKDALKFENEKLKIALTQRYRTLFICCSKFTVPSFP